AIQRLIDLYDATDRPGDAAKRRTEAAQLVTEQLAERRPQLKPHSPELGGLLATTGKTLLDFHPAAANPLISECLAIPETLPPQPGTTPNAMSLLAARLLLQKTSAAAEPLLVAGYDGLKADEQSIPPQCKANIPNAIQRLIDLYDATDKPNEAAKWRRELEA